MRTQEQAQRIANSNYSSYAYRLADIENGVAEPETTGERLLKTAIDSAERGELSNEDLQEVRDYTWPK